MPKKMFRMRGGFLKNTVAKPSRSGNTAQAYGPAVRTSAVTAAKKFVRNRVSMSAKSLVRKASKSIPKGLVSEADIARLEKMLDPENLSVPISFNPAGVIGAVKMASGNRLVKDLAKDAAVYAAGIAGNKAVGAAKGLFSKASSTPAIGSNAPDVKVHQTAAHRMMPGSSATEKPVGVLAFTISRKKSVFLKKVSNLFSTSTKFYTYQSRAQDYRWYTTGLNAKGIFFGGNATGDSKIIRPLITGSTANVFQANLNAIDTLTLASAQAKQDNFSCLNFTTYDDVLALYQTIPSGTTIGATSNNFQDIRFPMGTRTIEFEITNLNKYLNGLFDLYRLVAKTDIRGGNGTPEHDWWNNMTSNASGVGLPTDAGSLGFFIRNDVFGSATPYYGGVDVNLKATPGLSSVFKQQWDIDEVRRFSLQPDQTVKVVLHEQFSNGISLDEISRRLVGDIAMPMGSSSFMLQARTNPLYVERAASAIEPTNPAYNVIAESGFLNYKISNIKKYYTAHVPRRGDVNNPWANCLGLAQTTSIILPTYEYASGDYLDSTGALTGGKYSMPLVTPNAVQYGGKLD